MADTLAGSLFRAARRSSLGIKFKRMVKTAPVLQPVFKVLVQQMIDYRYPRTCNIEPTNACNQVCRMCPREQATKGVGMMPMDLFRKIIDESALYGPRNFQLHKDGEPLLHKHIAEMVRYIKERNPGSTVYMSSNGEILNRERGRALIEAGLDQLHVSIGAVTQETFVAVRGSRIQLSTVEQNVRDFVALKREMKAAHPVVTVQIIYMDETRDEIREFEKRWKGQGVELSIPDFLTWGGGVEQDSTVAEQNLRRRWPCHSLWTSPSINWNGDVSICCVDWKPEEVLGNLKTSNLADLWQGELLRRYRDLHLAARWDRVPICRDCNYWRETPDFFFNWQKHARASASEGDGRPRAISV
ncbi:MAG: radical SAM protein [Planctomycetes bacterium]|nr:radical SAM protein [Planctomycetota bacterium]